MSDAARQWVLVRTDTFVRELRKYLRKHPDREQLVRSTLRILATDPYSPTLRLHKLKGRMRDFSAVRLTYGDRIILTLIVTERQIVLLNIGTHDDVYL